MKVRITFILLMLAGVWTHMQGSYPTVVNYSRKEYAGGAQNWAVAQVPDGTMLFGNHYGLLTFNSRDWRLHGINYGSAVRGLYVDTLSKRVYAGGSNEFGYFMTSAQTYRTEYVSLIQTLDKSDRSFGEIWNIMKDDKRIWLQADSHMLCYDGKRTKSIKFDKKITSSALSGSKMYLGFDDGTVSRFDTGNQHLEPVGFSLGSRVCSLLPLEGGNVLIVTALHGVFIYDGIRTVPCLENIAGFLKEHQVFCSTIRNGMIAIGTVHCGAVICGLDGSDVTYINKSTGLQNNTVLRVAFDASGNLWLCLDNGLSCAAASSPVRDLLGNKSDYGAGYASMKRGNRMLLGTNQGLYSTPWPPASTHLMPVVNRHISGQIWAIDTIGTSLFVSGDLGLYAEQGDSFHNVRGIRGATSVTPLRKHPGYALVSAYEGFYLMRDNGAGWTVEGKVSGYDDVTGRPVEDKDGIIWLSHWQKGVYRMKLDVEGCRFEDLRLYTSRQGLPSDRDNFVQKLGDKLVFSTPAGFYRYSTQSDSFEPDISLDSRIRGIATSRLFRSPSGELWIVGGGRTTVVNTNLVGETIVDTTTYTHVGRKLIPGSESLDFVSSTRLVAGYEDGFYDIDLTTRRDSTLNSAVYISALYANQDSLLYAPDLFLPDKQYLEIPYSLNSVRFEFVAPDYSAESDILYSVTMEGLTGGWSQFSPLAAKEYTDLREGEYTFRVRASDRTGGVVSECSFMLRVLPPWYRSVWANFVYIVLILICLWLCYRLYERNSQKAALMMEERKNEELAEMEMRNREESIRKDYEIEQLKSRQLELDIRNKSNELSNSTLNLVRKNEILMTISDRLTKLAETMGSQPESERHVKAIVKIKELIRENISHDDDWKTFTRNFDLVYDNYMQRLLEAYPALTVTDQRLCAYIKMGLSSKEIAPLLNITYRSVEMNRYRLRKKMGMQTETSLSDYLRKF